MPQISGGPPSELDLPPKAPLPADLVATVLSVLHSRAPAAGVGQELSEAILTMVGNASQLLLSRPRPPPPGVGRPPPPPGPPRPPEQPPFPPTPLGSQVRREDGPRGRQDGQEDGGRTGFLFGA